MGFEGKDAFLRTHNLILILLEFLCDIAFRLSQSLLANPVRRYLIAISVAYLQVVPKDIVVTNFETLDTCRLYLSLLHLQQVTLALICDVAQLVELRIHAIHDDTAIRNEERAVGTYFASDAVTYLSTKIELLPYISKRAIVRILAKRLDRLYGLQSHSQLYDVPW